MEKRCGGARIVVYMGSWGGGGLNQKPVVHISLSHFASEVLQLTVYKKTK